MRFEWDDAKSNRCLARRGFDFTHAARAFLDPRRSVAADDRRDYGETRYRLLGTIDGRVYVVVYTIRRRAIRIISARRANARETARHEHDAHHR